MKERGGNFNKVLIVIGMHRSGTSLLTSWIGQMGLNMGDNKVKGDIGNIEGYHEDRDFHDFHEEVFRRNRISYGGLNFPLDFEIDYLDIINLLSLIDRKSEKNEQWGWKDPRTCLFLDVYRKYLPKAKYIVLYRDCSSVVDSLIRRDKNTSRVRYFAKSPFNRFVFPFVKKKIFKEMEKKNSIIYEAIWKHYNQKIISHLKEIDSNNYKIVSIKDLIENDKELYYHIVDNWGFNLFYTPFKNVYKFNLFNSLKDEEDQSNKLIREEYSNLISI